MNTTPVFKALTRDATIGGLPTMYLVVLMMGVMIPFIVIQDFILTGIMAAIGYPLLRALVAYDPKIIPVFITATQTTQLQLGALTDKGFAYRA